MPRAPALLPALAGPLLLAACSGGEKAAVPPAPEDAAIIAALFDPLMTDPDLAWQNEAHSAVAVSGPASSALPPIDRSKEAVDAAREDAARLVPGTPAALPAPAAEDLAPLREAVTAAQMAMAAQVARAGCLADVVYTARWAAALPEPLQVYPRGAVEEAAGTDAGDCGLRVVHFRTPVAVEDVLAFHAARLRAAGYPVRHGAEGGAHVLRGRKGGMAYVVFVRPAGDGLTAADIAVGGIQAPVRARP